MTPTSVALQLAQMHTDGLVRLINRNTRDEKVFIECACGEVFGPDVDEADVFREWTRHARSAQFDYELAVGSFRRKWNRRHA